MINNILKKIISIKYENILCIIYLPYMILNISKSQTDLILSAIIMHLLLIGGTYYSIRLIRQDLKECIHNLKPIKIIDLKAIKKELNKKALIINLPQPLLNKSFLNNSVKQLYHKKQKV